MMQQMQTTQPPTALQISIISVACLVYTASIAFCIHNINNYLIKQQRYKGRGIFMTIFYCCALANQTTMLVQVLHQYFFQRHMKEIYLFGSFCDYFYMLFIIEQVFMLRDLCGQLRSIAHGKSIRDTLRRDIYQFLGVAVLVLIPIICFIVWIY